MVRFHQGITAFDSVFRSEIAASNTQSLTASISKGLSSRFRISKVSVPACYTAKRMGFMNKKPPLTPVSGVDAIAIIRPLLTGTSEPQIAMQGYGVATARIGSAAGVFTNIYVELRDAQTTLVLKTFLFTEGERLSGVDWHSNLAEYTVQERIEIDRGLRAAFERIAIKLAEKCAI